MKSGKKNIRKKGGATLKNQIIRVCNSGITFSVFIPIVRLLSPLFLTKAWKFTDNLKKPSSVVVCEGDTDWDGYRRYDVTIPISDKDKFLDFVRQFGEEHKCKIDIKYKPNIK